MQNSGQRDNFLQHDPGMESACDSFCEEVGRLSGVKSHATLGRFYQGVEFDCDA